MIYLNGELVDEKTITPGKHKFIGMFRPPSWPEGKVNYNVFICPCGAHLWDLEACFDHWHLGHMDVSQYVDIE